MLKLIGKTHLQVLDNTPNVLSVGRLVRENKIGFHWPIGESPYLETVGGDRVILKVVNDVPYFSGKSMKVLLKADLAPIPDPLVNENSNAQNEVFPVIGDGTPIDQLAHPATTKLVCSDVGIQTEILDSTPPMPIGSRSLVESSGCAACP